MTPGERIARMWATGAIISRSQFAADINAALAAQRRADIRALRYERDSSRTRFAASWVWLDKAIRVLRERARKGKAKR